MPYSAVSFTSLEQPTLAKWNTLGTNDAYFDSLVGSGTAWTSWTPTLTNATNVNGTLACKYQQIGKIVFCRFSWVLGSSSTMGSLPTFSLPVTRAANGGTATLNFQTSVSLWDTSASRAYMGAWTNASTTTIGLAASAADQVYAYSALVSATTPFTWATGDEINGTFFYEAA